jgi:Flp pilus assembly protein TadB
LVGVVVGVGIPHLVIGIMGGKRRNKFNALFPKAST